jgi:uncharacterized protein (DUF1697 family)
MKYVALLRGINVGGRIIKMADLRSCCEKAGLKNVATVLQSGNVIFESDRKNLKSELEKALQARFNYAARAQVVPVDRLAKIVKQYPFMADDSKHGYVIFFENGLEKQLLSENIPEAPALETFKAGDGVVYWRVDKGSTLKSPLSKYIVKAAYRDFNTNRNINTLRKILAAASD